MLFGETLAVALRSIKANLLRSILTMLGIIIGVGAVITMVAMGSGAQRAIEDQIENMGARRRPVVQPRSGLQQSRQSANERRRRAHTRRHATQCGGP